MTNPPGGLAGKVTSRLPAIALKAALVYALADHQADPGVIDRHHLAAGLALSRYSAATVEHVFGDSLAEPTCDKLLKAVRAAGPAGLSLTDQHRALGSHTLKVDLDRARSTLEGRDLIVTGEVGSGPALTRVSVAIAPQP